MKKRTIAAVVAAIGLALGTTFVGRSLLHLPPPRDATDEQLIKWIVLRDLENEPEQTQLELMERFASLRQLPESATNDQPQLAEWQRDRILKNAELLRKKWFVHRAAEYQELTARERWAFLESQLETIDFWSTIVDQYGEKLDLPQGSLADWIVEIDQLVVDSPEPTRQALEAILVDGTTCWLATRDLRQLDEEVQNTMARRISIELDQGMSLAAASADMSPKQHQIFLSNCELLMRSWILDQVEGFRRAATSSRFDYVDERIRRVNEWGVFELLGGGEKGGVFAKAAGALRMRSMFRDWIQQADEADQIVMNDLYKVFLARLPSVLAK